MRKPGSRAARTILALQTIPSREVKPGELAVLTVGYITAGTKNNTDRPHDYESQGVT